MEALFGKIGKLCNADAEWALAVRARQIHLLGRWACHKHGLYQTDRLSQPCWP